jgi:cobalt-precorrin 5A hydrolase
VRLVVSVDLKKREPGLVAACRALELPFITVSRQRIRRFCGTRSVSAAARRHLGLRGVCEPAALLAGRDAQLILPKRRYPGVTVAVAREDSL